MIRFERRASTVLYNLLRSHALPGPILVPENVCAVVILVLQKLGRLAEPIQISLETMAMDHQRLEERWQDPCRPAPGGLLYVRPYGRVQDLGDVFRQLRTTRADALIIDDRCLGFPEPDAALEEGVDAMLFSTGFAKCVDLGFGGFAVTRAETPYRSEPGTYDAEAERHWADVARAAIATEQPIRYQDSDWLDRRPPGHWARHCLRMQDEARKSRAEKQRINAIYADGLPREVQFPSIFNDWRFNLWVRSSEDVLDSLFGHGLFASSHYRSIAPLVGGHVSVACAAVRSHVVNLFNYKYLDVEMAERIVSKLTRRADKLTPGPDLRSWRLGAGDE